MFKTEISVVSLKTIAIVVCTLFLLGFVTVQSLRDVEASNITEYSDVQSSSSPVTPSDHSFSFIATTGVASGEFIEITFPEGFLGIASINETDLDLEENGFDVDLSTNWSIVSSGNKIRFTSSGTGGLIKAGSIITIEIGKSATFDGEGVNQIVNPTVGSYEITVTSGSSDTGVTRIAIVDSTADAKVANSIFTFMVKGVSGGETVNNESITGGSSAITIPFGSLSNNVASTKAQDLIVTTNASNGYVVTAKLDQALQSSNGAIINGFVNGSDTDTPAVWTAPSGTLGSENTYGHWGITSDDATTTRDRADEFGSQEFVAASTSPRVVMSHPGPANGSIEGIGITRVGYKIEISSLQEKEENYTAILTYIATPTF